MMTYAAELVPRRAVYTCARVLIENNRRNPSTARSPDYKTREQTRHRPVLLYVEQHQFVYASSTDSYYLF